MLHSKGSALCLLLILQWVAGTQASACETELRCDFVCDCSDCSDEQDCGYSGKGSVCDFENSGTCGWTTHSLDGEYFWERRQRGDAIPESGPSSDFTIGTAAGWFMGVSEVKTSHLSEAFLVSPKIQQASPTCRLRLRYFLWDSGYRGFGSSPLWMTIRHPNSQESIIWRPEANSVRGWKEADIYLGRISTTFNIVIYSQRSDGRRGDVAIDQLEFLDCALPLQLPGKDCPKGMMECQRGGCVKTQQMCDGTDDCGDGTDEQNCGGYRRCDFETDTCDWDLRSLSTLKWQRTNQESISLSDPMKGPGRDHTNNSPSGGFLYVTVPEGDLKDDWAAFQSPSLEPTNSTHPCKLVMYTHQFGPRSGGLTVMVADTKIYPVWQRGGALGDLWVKAEVDIVTNSTFQILIMAAIRDMAYGGIAVDSIVLSPECRLSNGSSSVTEHPNPPEGACTQPDKMCDFHPDCPGGKDESKCGDFSYTSGSSGWTDTSIGSQSWVLLKGSTPKADNLSVIKAPGQQLTEALIRTPLLGPSGPACTVSFDYGLTGNPSHIGELSIRVIDSVLGMQPKLWEFSGKTGRVEGVWEHAEVVIGSRTNRFQLEIEARASKLCPCVRIKVTNVRYIGCHVNYLPSSPTGLSCNFEDGLCGWYQDNSDNFDWTVHNGKDHTIGIGKSLSVDMWSSSLRGMLGRLLSYPQMPTQSDYCLTFFYKLYGSNTGVLNVKLLDNNGFENIIWTRSGAHGNVWHQAHCPIAHQPTRFQLIFEAVRAGFDGQVAIDDVVFVEGPCTVPRMCSFEGQRCGFTSSGQIRWIHRNGHGITLAGPKTDHTLETSRGYYMMVNTGADILPSGGMSVLTSPVRYGTAKTECVNFWYYKDGVNPGYLTVYMKPVRGERVQIFSDSLSQGNVWRHGNANVGDTREDWQFEFEVVGAGGKDTSIAIDDIFVMPHACESQGSKCSLEKGMCSWSNTQNAKLDKLDWEVTSQEGESHYSTPPLDHTLGSEKGHFLIFPSSNRTSAHENAQLLSPHLPPTQGTCLKFWVYKSILSDSQLKVWTLSRGLLQQQMVIKEQGGSWERFNVNIKSTEEYQIVFEGITGTSGTLALDDIEYTVGVDCDHGISTPPTEPAGDDNGALAASVVIVLLLIGTVVGLLVCYLRIKQRHAEAQTGPSPQTASFPSTPSAGVGFSNEIYEADPSQDRMKVSAPQNHPMAAGFNNVSEVSVDIRDSAEA